MMSSPLLQLREAGKGQAHIPARPRMSSVSLGESFSLSEPVSSSLKWAASNSHLRGFYDIPHSCVRQSLFLPVFMSLSLSSLF